MMAPKMNCAAIIPTYLIPRTARAVLRFCIANFTGNIRQLLAQQKTLRASQK